MNCPYILRIYSDYLFIDFCFTYLFFHSFIWTNSNGFQIEILSSNFYTNLCTMLKNNTEDFTIKQETNEKDMRRWKKEQKTSHIWRIEKIFHAFTKQIFATVIKIVRKLIDKLTEQNVSSRPPPPPPKKIISFVLLLSYFCFLYLFIVSFFSPFVKRNCTHKQILDNVINRIAKQKNKRARILGEESKKDLLAFFGGGGRGTFQSSLFRTLVRKRLPAVG